MAGAWLCSRRIPPELQRSASPAQTAGIPAKETDSQTVTREARERARWPRAAHGICGTPPYPLVDSSAREIQLYRVRMQSPATAHKRRESEAGVHGHARTSFGPPRPSRWPAICTCPTSPSATHLRVGRRERALGATLEQTWESTFVGPVCVTPIYRHHVGRVSRPSSHRDEASHVICHARDCQTASLRAANTKASLGRNYLVIIIVFIRGH